MPDYGATSKSLRCYRCGISLEALSPPLGRRDLCPECGVELHVCRMCRSFAPSAPDACLEEDAIAVRVKTSANFCDYFAPNPDAYDSSDQRADKAARSALDALFADNATTGTAASDSEAQDSALRQAEDLFKK